MPHYISKLKTKQKNNSLLSTLLCQESLKVDYKGFLSCVVHPPLTALQLPSNSHMLVMTYNLCRASVFVLT